MPAPKKPTKAKKPKDELKVALSEKVQIHVRKVQDDEGAEYLDVRQHVTGPKYTGYTKKGVRVPADKVHEFVSALCEVEGTFEE